MKKPYLFSYISLVSFLGFAVISLLVVRGFFLGIDNYIYQNLPYSSGSFIYYLSRMIANLYLPLLILIFVLLWRFRNKKQKFEVLILLSTFSGWLVTEFLFKLLFHISCPPIYYANIANNQELFKFSIVQKIGMLETCYPSGHTVSYVVFFGYLLYLSLTQIKRIWLRYLSVITFLIIILLIGPSRIYLHVHWFSDVIAGYLLGLGILSLIIGIHNHYLPGYMKRDIIDLGWKKARG